jgi:ATP-dependent metalloprotease
MRRAPLQLLRRAAAAASAEATTTASAAPSAAAMAGSAATAAPSSSTSILHAKPFTAELQRRTAFFSGGAFRSGGAASRASAAVAAAAAEQEAAAAAAALRTESEAAAHRAARAASIPPPPASYGGAEVAAAQAAASAASAQQAALQAQQAVLAAATLQQQQQHAFSPLAAAAALQQAHHAGGAGAGGPAGAGGAFNPAAAAALATTNPTPGSARNPLVITYAEPSLASQMARLVRFLGLAFIGVTAVGAFLDEKALSKGLLNSPDLTPQLDSSTRFADVKGVDEAKAELEEIVAYLRDPSRFTSLGGKLPKGVLLVGPPGTGKTMLARAVAGEAGVPFFYTSGSEFEEVFVGVGARRVRDLFAAAKKHAPCIVFIDEIDAIGGNRSPKDQTYMRMTLNQLLVELDGFKPAEGVIVVAATNFAEVLDKALVRPGRFDRHVVVPAPDVAGRVAILEQHLKAVPVAKDVDLRVIARGTPGFSGADLANLVNNAALHSAKAGGVAVDMAAMEAARDRILMGAERKSAAISEGARRLTAYHEGGHALVAVHTRGADPVHKATIVPRGSALGMVTQLPEEDHVSASRRQMLARLDVCMAGRAAEALIFGEDDVTSGASSDLRQATSLARAMVTRYGMSEKVGAVALDYEGGGGAGGGDALSGETRALVEAEVRRLVEGAAERARSVLVKHEAQLHALAGELLERETLSGADILALVERVGGGGGGGSKVVAAAGVAAGKAAASGAGDGKQQQQQQQPKPPSSPPGERLLASAKAAAAKAAAAASSGAGAGRGVA